MKKKLWITLKIGIVVALASLVAYHKIGAFKKEFDSRPWKKSKCDN